jgi:hypothetical protein
LVPQLLDRATRLTGVLAAPHSPRYAGARPIRFAIGREQEDSMRGADSMMRFLSLIALWLIAGMLYVQHFHAGQRDSAKPAEVKIDCPQRFAVVNADGAPLRIAGEVTLANPPAPPPVKIKMACRLTGMITTHKPVARLFGGSEWKPEREWPVEARLDCETPERTQ